MTEVKSATPPKILLQDESYDPEKTGSYHLSLMHNVNRLCCVVLDKNENKYIYLDTAAKISALPAGWSSVSCSVAHHEFTLVPSALFEETLAPSLLSFNHQVKEDEEICFNTLHNAGAKNLFTVKKAFAASIRRQFPSATFIHSSTSFIEGVMTIHKNNPGKKAFANFTAHGNGAGYFEMMLLDGKDLLFSNSFKYGTADEIAYYILFVYEQLNLNPESIELVLSGEIEKTSKEHALLYTYIRHVRFAARPENFRYSYKFEEIPNHQFYSLFTQFLVTN